MEAWRAFSWVQMPDFFPQKISPMQKERGSIIMPLIRKRRVLMQRTSSNMMKPVMPIPVQGEYPDGAEAVGGWKKMSVQQRNRMRLLPIP